MQTRSQPPVILSSLILLGIGLILCLTTPSAKAQGVSEQQINTLIGLLRQAEPIAKDEAIRLDVKQAREALESAVKSGNAVQAKEYAMAGEMINRAADNSKNESMDFKKLIAEARQTWAAETSGVPAEVKPLNPTTTKGNGTLVMDMLRRSEKDTANRAAARDAERDAEKRRFEPAANDLVNKVKASGLDLSGYLLASAEFVNLPYGKVNKKYIDAVNQTYSDALKGAVAKAVGSPDIGGILQGQQGNGNEVLGSGNPVGSPNAAACCSTNRFEPPFEGLFTEGSLGTSAIRGGETRQLEAQVRSAIAAAPHNMQQSGRGFNVPANSRHVSVTVNLGTNWVIGLSGVGYSHVWLGLNMSVVTPGGISTCSAPHIEQDNQWTWAGGSLMLSDHRPGPPITMTCSFDRSVSDSTEYAVSVGASADGTFFGFSGGYGDYYVDLGTVEVTACP